MLYWTKAVEGFLLATFRIFPLDLEKKAVFYHWQNSITSLVRRTSEVIIFMVCRRPANIR